MGSKKTTTTSRREIPSWLEEGSKRAVALGQEVAGQKYAPYQGQRVAGLTANEQQASQLATSGGQGREYLSRAASSLEGANDQANIDKYMNPYLENVLNPALRKTGEAFDTRRTDLKKNAGKVNAFGGDRQSLLETQLDKNYLQTVGDLTGQIKAQGYEDARARQERATESWRQLAGDTSQMDRGQIQDLMLTGGTERLLQQAGKDFEYQQFTENRDWNIRNLGPLLASLQAPHSTTQTDTTKESGGALGQILGAAATVAAAFFTGGASLAVQGAASAAAAVGGKMLTQA